MLENFRLRVFRAVAEHLNFRKAGEALYLSQPAVTSQIKALEEELDVKLFERSAAGVRLTAAGETLRSYAIDLCEIAEKAEAELAALKGQISGELSLGASTTIAQYVLPPLLAEFSRKFPAIRLTVHSQNTEHIAEGVASGRFSLGLIEGPPLRKDLKVESWFDDELLLVVPASHEWANRRDVPAAEIAQMPLLMRERGSGSRHVVEQALQRAGLKLKSLKIVMELDSTEAMLSCIESGLGVGFASVWAIKLAKRADALAVLRISGEKIVRSFSFVTQQGPGIQHAAAAMMKFLQTAATAHKKS